MSGLIADIGATNARFAQVDAAGNIGCIDVLACADYPSLTAAAKSYLCKYSLSVTYGGFAVAGPVLGDEIRLTNLPWVISQKQTQSDLGLTSLRIVNDFTAIAYAVPHLTAADYYRLGEGSAKKGAPIGIIGPGTGLGVAALVFDAEGNAIPVTTEGGHITMHAQTQREFDIIAYLKKNKYSHISAERLVSGKGILNLYQAICGLANAAPDKTDPAEITQAALDNACPFSMEALDLFASMLGSVAGNYALSLGAFGGIYIAGGVVPKLGDWFKTSRFRDSFLAKGRYHDYLSAIPVFVITNPYPGFIGLKHL
jgi:glucokinase